MKHNREFWTRHVRCWRASGLTQVAYCRRHRLAKGTLGYWASTLKKPKAPGGQLVEVGRAQAKEQRQSSPIELVVERRYLLRLWPGMESGHLREVLSVLEDRR
jgi:hypothetical protein